MRIEDCLPLMAKRSLSRIADSILRDDVPRGGEEQMANLVRQHVHELGSATRIQAQLQPETMTHAERVLMEALLTGLLKLEEGMANEGDLFEEVQDFEMAVLERAQKEDCFQYSDSAAVDIYSTVLEVALDDGEITADEFALLNRLRDKLGLSRLDHRLLLARLNHFPRPGGEPHGFDEVREALRSLQRRGLVFYCNKAKGGGQVVLPDEILPGVKQALGFEMRDEAQLLLHDALGNQQLRSVLVEHRLPLSGSKDDRSQRIIAAGVRPSEVLAGLSGPDLTALCKKLPGLKTSGTKADQTERVLDYFASLSLKRPESSDDPRAVSYQYLEEFAMRDNQNLYQLKLIKHDREMERAFEDGTRFLFESKLGLQLIQMEGTEHADGGVAFPNGELLLWDNKSKESDYTLPQAHQNQFRRYIHNSLERVNIFLVIVPEVASTARLQAMKLKQETKTDTDIALITARDIKWLAENWRDQSKRESFNVEIFNYTGHLDRQVLEERLMVLG